MRVEMELQQMIYEILLTQIQFGTYRYMDGIPAANVVSENFHVSVDTVQLAYRRLKKEGYISLSKNVGAKVIVFYTDEEIEQHIQTFFLPRKDALLDLSNSLQPLLGHIQWLGLKHASPETLEHIGMLFDQHAQKSHIAWQFFEQKYTDLGNDTLMRLARQVSLFFQTPFYNIADNANYLGKSAAHVEDSLALCSQRNWPALKNLIDTYQCDLRSALYRFYQERIPQQTTEQKVAFRWCSYKKTNQLCYSLAMELLLDIYRGIYPAGGLLPTMEQLSKEKDVSISTVRRAIGLLVSNGAVKSSRPYGMRVLPIQDSVNNCDFTQPILRQRLLDMVECLQIFALSCRSVAELTLRSLDDDSIELWKQKLSDIKNAPCYDVLSYNMMKLIANFAPYTTLRTVYSELLQHLFWGNPLRGMRESQETTNALLEPYLSSMLAHLEERDIPGFCDTLEAMMLYELQYNVNRLLQVGIQEAKNILVPEKGEWGSGR